MEKKSENEMRDGCIHWTIGVRVSINYVFGGLCVGRCTYRSYRIGIPASSVHMVLHRPHLAATANLTSLATSLHNL